MLMSNPSISRAARTTDTNGTLHLSSLKSLPVNSDGQLINVPIFLIDAFNLIMKNVTTVGLFRKSGNAHRVKSMRDVYFGKVGIPEEATIYDVCDLVKYFFRELDEPILTSALQEHFVRFATNINRLEVRAKSFLHLCSALPPRHQDTLAYLMRQLHKISSHSAENKMDIHNLALVMALTIFRTNESAVRRSPAAEAKEKARVDLKVSVVEQLIKFAYSIGSFREYEKVISPEIRRQRMLSEKLPTMSPSRLSRVSTVAVNDEEANALRAKVSVIRRKTTLDRSSSKDTTSSAFENKSTPPSHKFAFASRGRSDQRRKTASIHKKTVQQVARVSRSQSYSGEQPTSELVRRRSAHSVITKIRRGQPNTVHTYTAKSKGASRLTRSTRSSGAVSPAVDEEEGAFSMTNTKEYTENFLSTATRDGGDIFIPQTKENQPPMSTSDGEDEDVFFCDSDIRKRQILESTSHPPQLANLHPAACQRPSVAFIRSANKGRVRATASLYEAPRQNIAPAASMEKEKAVSKQRSPRDNVTESFRTMLRR